MKKNKLKPWLEKCPFCGSAGELYGWGITKDIGVRCSNHDCCSFDSMIHIDGEKYSHCRTEEEAVAIWNRRKLK